MSAPRTRLGGLAATTTAATAVLLRCGRGALTPPPASGGKAALAEWLATRDAVSAFLALARLGALAVAGYLTLVVVAGAVLRAAEAAALAPRTLRRALDRATLSAVRAILDTAFGAGIAMSSAVLALGPPGPSPAPPPSALPAAHVAATDRVPTLRRVVDLPASTPAPGPASTAPGPAAAPRSATAADGRPTWTVRRGEHFWAIAESVVAARAAARPPTEREIARYWLRLVAANRDRLPVRTNPDLLFPGTVLVLPALSPGAVPDGR